MSPADPQAPVEPPRAEYRIRTIWIGVVVMLAGLVLGATAVILVDWRWGVAAAVVLLAGAAVSIAGRIMRDTHGNAPLVREIDELKDPEGADTSGRDPGATARVDPRGHEVARPGPVWLSELDLAHAWGFGLLVLGGWLLVAAYALSYPTELRSGIDGRWRDVTSGVILVLVGVWAARANRFSRLAVAGAVGAAVILLLLTATTSVPTTGMRLNELACGVLALIFGSLHGWYAKRWDERAAGLPGPRPEHKPH